MSETSARDDWDRRLSLAADGNVFQSYAWGEYKRASGWVPSRWLAAATRRDNKPLAMVQLLVRSYPGGARIGWAPGGPVTQFPGRGDCPLHSMLAALRDEVGREGLSYARLCSYLPSTPVLSGDYGRLFNRPLFRLTSGHTLRLDLTLPLDQLMGRMKAKHRYYVKKALGERIHWVAGNDAAMIGEFARLHREMAASKRLSPGASGQADFASLCQSMREQALILAGMVEGRAVAACLVLLFGKKAFYLRAAAGQIGRRLGASYAMLYQLLEQLQKLGQTELDFGGVVPGAASMAGVNHFKEGFGGEAVQYLGEWEWARSPWLRFGANLGIRLRGGAF